VPTNWPEGAVLRDDQPVPAATPHARQNLPRVDGEEGSRTLWTAAGWRVIVVTAGDLTAPRMIVARVHQALVQRGYPGPDPVFSLVWDAWFPTCR
jgi:hypothetical protein